MSARFRGIAFTIFLWGSVVCYGSLLLVLAPFVGKARLIDIARHWQQAVLIALKRFCGIEHRLHGGDALKVQRPLVVASNHQSAWETIALATLLPDPQTWVMKQELLRIPFFGWALALFEPIAIKRSDGRRAMRQLLEIGRKRLAQGRCVVIFPEGTRVAPGAHRRFGLGAALLAARTGTPIVPVAHNAGQFWPRRGVSKFPGMIDVVIGPLIETQGLSPEAVNSQVEEWIRQTLHALPAGAPAASQDEPADTSRENSCNG
jgi:1-acyl-sn-glycerol-3-phosphate acyltransferase